MKAAEWIDRIKRERGWESDYRVAQELGLSRATVSKYRSRDMTFDEDVAVKVASTLGYKPEIILIDQVLERSRNDDARAAIGRALKRLGGVAAGVVVAVGVGGSPAPAQAATTLDQGGLYIMSTRRRRRSPLRAMVDQLVKTFAYSPTFAVA